MKVLIVTNMWPSPDSIHYGIFVKEQVEAIEKYYPEANIRIFFINGRKNKMAYLWSIFKVNWLLLFHKYEVVHIHYALSGLFLFINPFIKSPIITTLHGSDFNATNKVVQKIINRVLKKSSDIIYLNNKMKDQVRIYNKKMHHIPCGVNTDLFRPNRVFNKKENIRIAFPASKLRPEKNYAFFEKVINALEVQNNYKIKIIEIHGKTRKEVNEILNTVDLLCMTSFTEGSPQIIKEAMCCNTPIVSSNVGDVMVLLNNVNNAFVVDTYVLEDFSKVINRILHLPIENRLSNGRKRVFELGLDEESTSRKVIKAYMT